MKVCIAIDYAKEEPTKLPEADIFLHMTSSPHNTKKEIGTLKRIYPIADGEEKMSLYIIPQTLQFETGISGENTLWIKLLTEKPILLLRINELDPEMLRYLAPLIQDKPAVLFMGMPLGVYIPFIKPIGYQYVSANLNVNYQKIDDSTELFDIQGEEGKYVPWPLEESPEYEQPNDPEQIQKEREEIKQTLCKPPKGDPVTSKEKARKYMITYKKNRENEGEATPERTAFTHIAQAERDKQFKWDELECAPKATEAITPTAAAAAAAANVPAAPVLSPARNAPVLALPPPVGSTRKNRPSNLRKTYRNTVR
jgi:hypothetical protein